MSTKVFYAVSRCTATATGTPSQCSCSLEARPRSRPTLKSTWRERKLPIISRRYLQTLPARITQPVRIAVAERAVPSSTVAPVVARLLSAVLACRHPLTVRPVSSGSHNSNHRRCRNQRQSSSLSRTGKTTASSKKSALIFTCGARRVRNATATSLTAKTEMKWNAFSLQITFVSASYRRACALLTLLAVTFDEGPGRLSAMRLVL